MKFNLILLLLMFFANVANAQGFDRPYNCDGENGAEIAFFIKAGEPVNEYSSFIAEYFYSNSVYSYLKCAPDAAGGKNFNCRVRSGDTTLTLSIRENQGPVLFEANGTNLFGRAYRETGTCEVGPT